MKLLNIFLFIAVLLFGSAAQAEEPSQAPRLLVHLLDYLAKDYGGAVADGKIISEFEYAEQVEFSKTALKTASEIPAMKDAPELKGKLDRLNVIILNKGSAEQVALLAREIQTQVMALSQLEMAPTRWPNLERGKKLFTQNCTSCHGMLGQGDGPAGAGLEPPPANFMNREAMENVSPFQAYNAIRLGIPGTGMAPYNTLSDQDVWDLAFYVISLRHQENKTPLALDFNEKLLKQVATLPDAKLKAALPEGDKAALLAALRTHSGGSANYLETSKAHLSGALQDYEAGLFEGARAKALKAYLEGVEPIEPRLRANDGRLVAELEAAMANVRAVIEARKPLADVRAAADQSFTQLARAEQILNEKEMSPWLAFVATMAIFLREGFEAILIIIVLLGVVRATGAQEARYWIHVGWLTALGLGIVTWFFSGWIMAMSGADREVMESIVSLMAVAILLYLGFWLHSRTEITRWKGFIEDKIRKALDTKNLLGLSAISFIAVFREAFETVLFLRAISLESGPDSRLAMGFSVIISLGAVVLLAWALLRFSAKLPIRKLFTLSSSIMAVLAIILTGKGLHSLQESGFLSINSFPLNLRWEFFGFYPTFETLLSQAAVLLLVIVLWSVGSRPRTVEG